MSSDKPIARPAVRFSLRWKIILPFIFLALVLGLGAVFLVNRLLSENTQARFVNQLLDGGQQAADAVVRTEVDLLEVLRLISNTEGVSSAAAVHDSEALRSSVLPLVINSTVDAAVILDQEASSLLTIRHRLGDPPGEYEILKGERFYADWNFVQQVIYGGADAIGDKYVGIHELPSGEQNPSIFYVGGPLRDSQGKHVGAVLVGVYLQNVVEQLGDAAGANVSIYSEPAGYLLNTTLEPEDSATLTLPQNVFSQTQPSGGEGNSAVRSIRVAGNDYLEVLFPFLARRGTVDLGVMGVSLLEAPVQDALIENALSVAKYGAVALLLVVAIGLLVSNAITRPLIEIADASARVAAGNLDTHVSTRTGDEIGVLAKAFNTLVANLRERTLYHDVAGPTAVIEAPEESYARESTSVEGNRLDATVLSMDIGSFVSDADQETPQTILKRLNDLYQAVEPVIVKYGGAISAVTPDLLMVVFGVLPRPIPLQISAANAVKAAIDSLDIVTTWNQKRASQGMPALEVWMGITSGPVIAGGIGLKDRLNFSAIGATVMEAREVQKLAHQLGGQALLITEETHDALAEWENRFHFGRSGKVKLSNLGKTTLIYEVKGRRQPPPSGNLEENLNWTEEQADIG